jgi:hypothetical protein
VYYAFDLLHLDGFDTRTAPLLERKRVTFGRTEIEVPRARLDGVDGKDDGVEKQDTAGLSAPHAGLPMTTSGPMPMTTSTTVSMVLTPITAPMAYLAEAAAV